ncbi:MAG: metallophosphoesterase family protein [Longimicrobiales bacterium]|nr:metallophosphoesterase family protein [Longimicrobiales bacterium]
MKLLLCSDLHRDLDATRELVARSSEADVLVCAGDLAVMRNGLQEVVDVLADAACPAVLVPGNGESDGELVEACAEWPEARVLHGSGCEIDGVAFWGLGAAVPVTPFGSWSFDLPEHEAEALLADCPEGAVLVTHSPPRGHVDAADGGKHLGSEAVLQAVERTMPRLVVCGHVHACWGRESMIGETRVINAGPDGIQVEL